MDIAAERAYATPFANSTLLPMLLLSLAQQKHSPDLKTTVKDEYDFIIVGAGASGSVVASRLSEIPCVNVLLLEAGKAPPLLTDVPAISGSFYVSDIAWPFVTVPQKYAGYGLVNRQVHIPMGKAVGGSSIINAMVYVRGNRKDYDHWADSGATGWAYKDIYRYLIKLEDNQNKKLLKNGFHSMGGPMTVENPRYNPKLKTSVLKAVPHLGYKVVDINAYTQTGFYDHQATQRNNQRCSTAKAYLVPAEDRTNLDIVANAHVRKIVMEGNRAVGVEYDFNNVTSVVRTKTEVILSAGSINTPQLLMLSGIGPKQHLEDLKIDVVADLPVGDNLHNHISTVMNFQLKDRPIDKKNSDPRNIKRYIHKRSGPLSATLEFSALAFLGGVPNVTDYPNYQLYFTEITAETAQSKYGLTPEACEQVYGPYQNQALYVCQSQLLRPKSRGTIRLQSTDPYDLPLIDPNYLEDPSDVQDIVDGLKTCRKVGTSKLLRKIGSKPFTTLYPGCEEYAGDDDLYFGCQARTAPLTLHHPVGTCKMGNPEDPTTVLDPQLRVKGIDGLRVVDCSIMPRITTGNTYIPAVMIGERASDIIKASLLSLKTPN